MPRKSNVSMPAGDEAAASPAAATSSSIAAGPASTPAGSKDKAESKDRSEGKEKPEGKDKVDGRDKKDDLAIEDLSLPRTMIQRLARGVLPPNTQIQKDAVSALSKSATLFMNHLAAAAATHTEAANRKTMQPADALAGLRDTEMAFLVSRVEAEVAAFANAHSTKRNEYRRKTRDSLASTDAQAATSTSADGQISMTAAHDGAKSHAKGISAESLPASANAQLAQETAATLDRERGAKRKKGANGAALAASTNVGGIDQDESMKDVDVMEEDGDETEEEAEEDGDETEEESVESSEEGSPDDNEDEVEDEDDLARLENASAPASADEDESGHED